MRSLERIRRIVRRTLEELPPSLQNALEKSGAVIDLLDEPPEDVEPDTMGTCAGSSYYEFEIGEAFLPEAPRIELYLSGFRDLEADLETFEEEVRLTVIHEIGHFLGLSEEDLKDV